MRQVTQGSIVRQMTLLDADPLVDIKNTRLVSGVMVTGRMIALR
jgi:hypothetical protein